MRRDPDSVGLLIAGVFFLALMLAHCGWKMHLANQCDEGRASSCAALAGR